MALTKPMMTEIPNGIEIAYIEEQYWPVIQLRNFNRNRNGDLVTELDGFCMEANVMIPVKGVKFNINSLEMRRRVAKGLKESYENVEGTWVDWERILADVSWRAIKFYRDGDAAEEIWPSEDVTLTPEYLLEPLLYLNHPSSIFGDYGSAKSLFALVVASVCQLPFHDNNLGLIAPAEPAPCLYLDYEDDPSSFRKRWSALQRGFGTGAMPILYRRMTATLADSVEQLRNTISDNKVKLVIVDSLGPAARGNLNDPEPAIRYHAALRQFGITSLTLAHTAKDQLTKRRTIFGSVFFTNLARSVWECKAEQETGEDEAVISLKHTKANLSRLHPPLGYRFSFTDDAIRIEKTDLRDTGLSGELPLSWQIKNLLRKGSFTVKEIAEQLGSGADTIGRTLRRMRAKNQVVKLEDDTWGLSV
jgi:hypothetical protein